MPSLLERLEGHTGTLAFGGATIKIGEKSELIGSKAMVTGGAVPLGSEFCRTLVYE
jgi:hypothetical protein